MLVLVVKLISVLCIEYIFSYLCTDYVDATIEFMQAYIQVLELLNSQREARAPGDAAAARFADVHYFFDTPSSKPQHHRFDRGSYVYVYHNAIQRRARIEVANHPGTPDQDAFVGYLDTVILENSFKHPHLFSLTVEGLPPSSPSDDQSQWHLPAFDLKNEQKYLYKIHSLDLYLWTASESTAFLEAAKRSMPEKQLQLVEPPPPAEHYDTMSPVVQQLEQAAIDTPYRPRAGTAQSGAAPSTNDSSGESVASASLPVPVAYNPAAPAAPEPIAHREKTPPPEEGVNATPFGPGSVQPAGQYATRPAAVQQSSYHAGTPQQSYFPGPPQRNASGSFPPPPSNGAQASPRPSSSFPSSPPGMTPPQAQHQSFGPPYSQATFQPITQFASYPQQAAYVTSPGLAGHTPVQSAGFPGPPGFQSAYIQQSVYSPGIPQHTPLQSPGFAQHTPMQSPGMTLPPPPSGPPAGSIGGYSNYTYTQQTQPGTQSDAYTMHTQLYRPTEAEAAHGQGGSSHPTPPDKFNTRISRVEKGVGRFLKRLDQKI